MYEKFGLSMFARCAALADIGALGEAAEVLGTGGWLSWVLTCGDDHALVATFPPAVTLPSDWTLIGKVAKGCGVVIDGKKWTGAGGWDHFRP